GNFGDGTINAFNPTNGVALGMLQSSNGKAIQIDGLWALRFGNGGKGGDPNLLYFTAGQAKEEHGLFGSIAPVSSPSLPPSIMIAAAASTNGLIMTWSGGSPPYQLQEKTSLSQTNWTDVLTTTNLSVTVPLTGAASFFRISDQNGGGSGR